MKAERTFGVVEIVTTFVGFSRRAVLMLLVLLTCDIASAQAHQQEFASIYRPGASLTQPAPLSLPTTDETVMPVNLRAEIGHFFDEPTEGVLKLPFNLSGKSNVSVVITTLDGKTAYQLERQDVAPGPLQLIIDLRAAGLSDGEYMVQIGLNRSQSTAHYAQTVALR